MTRTPVYAQVTDVVARLELMDPDTGLRKILTESTNPKASEVEDRIFAIEDYVESYCRDQWRISSSEVEYYGADALWTSWYPYELYTWVRNRHLQPLDSSQGDILQVRQGGNWVDLLDGQHEEGENKDFWVEYGNGIIHFYKTRPQYGFTQVKVKYRWGSTPVPYDIKRAVTSLVAADLLKSEIYTVTVGDGPGFVTNRGSTARAWEAEAMDILNRHQRQPISTLGM